jgi:hypothetical protein
MTFIVINMGSSPKNFNPVLSHSKSYSSSLQILYIYHYYMSTYIQYMNTRYYSVSSHRVHSNCTNIAALSATLFRFIHNSAEYLLNLFQGTEDWIFTKLDTGVFIMSAGKF